MRGDRAIGAAKRRQSVQKPCYRASKEDFDVGAFVVFLAGATRRSRFGERHVARPGSKNMCKWTPGFPRNLGAPAIPTAKFPAGAPGYQLQAHRPAGGGDERDETNHQQHVVSPSDEIRSKAKRMAGSRSVLKVPEKAGNSCSTRTRPREARHRIKQPLLGPTASAQKLGKRINETAADSRVGETFP